MNTYMYLIYYDVSTILARQIHNKAAEIRASKRCPCNNNVCLSERILKKERGYTVTVAIVGTMGDTVTTNFVGAARNYTLHLRQSRGYASPAFSRCDDDIIIFVSAKQEVVRFCLAVLKCCDTDCSKHVNNLGVRIICNQGLKSENKGQI